MDYKEFSTKIKAKYPQYNDMDDRELAQKMIAKYPQYKDVTFDSPQVEQPQNTQPTQQPLQGKVEQTDYINQQYDDIVNNNSLTKEQKLQALKDKKTEIDKKIDRDKWKDYGRLTLGGLMQGASMHPIFNIPYVGTGLGGGLFDAGSAIIEGKKGSDIAKQAGRGFLIGETIGAVPYVGKAVGKTKAGQAVINKVASSQVGKTAGKILNKKIYLNDRARRYDEVLAKRAEQQLERATRPEVQPSQYGVANIDSTRNKAIAEQIEKNITPETEIQKLTKAGMTKDRNAQLRQIKNEIEIPQITKGQYIKGRYKNRYYTKNVTDDLTQGFIDADTALADEIKAIKKNPEIINGENYLDEAQARLNEKVEGLPEEAQIEYYNKFYNAYNKANEYNTLKGKPITPEELGFIENIKNQPEIVNGKLSQLAQNAEKSEQVAQAIKENQPMYEVLHNQDLTAQAQKEIAENPYELVNITNKLNDNEIKNIDALDIEKTRQLFSKLQQEGRFDEATELLQNVSKQGSKLGQAVQAFTLWSKTTPEGAQLYAQKLLDKYNKGVRKSLQKQLTKEELLEIGEAFKNLNEAGYTGRELEVETAKAMKKVFKVVPKSFGQKLDAYRYMNMLLSFKSRVKDAILTAKNASDIAIDETIAGGIDKLRSLVSKDKTRYVSSAPQFKEWLKGAGKGYKNAVEDIKYGINTSRSGEVGRYGLPNTPTFEAQPLTGNIAQRALTFAKNLPAYGEKALRYTLNVPDRAFFEGRFASSVANQLKARGLKEPTQDIINNALKEAQRAVYQENRALTDMFSRGTREIDKVTINRLENLLGLPEYSLPSLSRTVAPFVKTPTNVIMQGVEGLTGAPVGALKLLKAQTPEEIRQAELLMGRGIRGLGELGLGVGIGKGIWDNVKTNIGNDNYYQNEITGLKPSSVVLGDKAFSMQNMQTNLPVISGVGLGQGGWSKALTNTTDEMANMPALKALGDMYNLNKEARYLATSEDKTEELKKLGNNMAKSLGINYLSSLLPMGGLLGEIRNDIDPYARELRNEDLLQYTKNRLANRIPGLSKTLPMKYNAIGEPVYANNINNALGRVASEALDFGVRNYTPSEEYNRLEDYKKSVADSGIRGRTTVGVQKAPRKVEVNGEKITLNNKQYSEYQKAYGKLNKKLKNEFLQYNADWSDEDKVKELSKINSSIKQAIEIMQFGAEPEKLKPYTEDILNNYEELINN